MQIIPLHNREYKFNMFHFFNIHNQYKQKFPIITPIICLFLISIHVCVVFNSQAKILDELTVDELKDAGALIYPDITDIENIWQFASHSVLHVGLYHLGNNVVTLAIFGSYIEIKYRWYRILIIYILSCIAAGLSYITIHMMNHIDIPVVMVGASGGIFGLMGVLISEFYLNWELFTNKLMRLGTIALIIGSHALEYIIQDTRIATGAHLGGLIYGIAPAVLYLPNYRWDPWEGVFLVLGVIMHIMFFITMPVYIYLQK